MRRPYLLAAFSIAIAVLLFAFAIRADATTAVQIFSGGTGTSTAPAYGQLLIGGQNGEYELVASSTLGGGGGTGFSTTSAAYWLTQQSTSNLAEGSNLYFTNARAISALTGQSNSIFTNGAGYLTSLAGAASSTILGDNNTFSGVDAFTNGSSNFAGTWQGFSPSHFQVAGTYVTSIGATWPVLSSGGTTPTLSWGGISTSSNPSTGNLAFWTAANKITSIATSSLALTTGAFASPNVSQWTNDAGYVTSSFSTTSAAYWQSVNNFFSTTSAAYWQTQDNFFSTTSAAYWQSVNSFFSTTSASYFLSLNQGNAFSTTSANYWGGTKGYLTSLAGAASSTLLGDNNTFSGNDSFTNASSNFSSTWQTFSPSHFQTALGFTPVPNTRNVNTTYPLQGGGALSSDLTISTAFGTTTANIWSQIQTFTSGFISQASSTMMGNLTAATTTTTSLNGAIVVGQGSWMYPMTDSGVRAAVSVCQATAGCGTVIIPAGTVTMNNPISLSGDSNLTIQCYSQKTVFSIPQASLGNFGFSYMFSGGSTDNNININDCYFAGGYSGYTSPPANEGGEVAPGNGWTLNRDVFADSNYFGVWLGSTASNDKIYYSNFIGPGRGNDDIGGGSGHDIEIAYNTWQANEVGNVFDNVNGANYNIHDNTIYSPHNIYLEGMQGISVYNNTTENGGSIIAQSDSGYNPPIVSNSNNISIYHNKVSGGGSIEYQASASSTSVLGANGGNVSITDNYIATSTQYAILLQFDSASTSQWGANYSINDNTIYDPNTSGSTSINTGEGIIDTSGINLNQGRAVVLNDNTITDDRTTPLMQYGIEIGQHYLVSDSNEPNHVTLSGNRISGYVLGDINRVSATHTPDYVQWSDSTSTLSGSGGINITTGCFAVNGTCLVSAGANYWTANGNDIYNNNSRYVGIGTTTPDAGLQADNYQGLAALHVGDIYQNSSITKLLVDNRWSGAGGYTAVFEHAPGTPQLTVDGNGFIGIGTSTEGSILSVQGVANFVANATSTMYNGLNLTSGCVSVQGVCLTSNTGTLTSITAGAGLSGNTITTSGTISLTAPVSIANGGTATTTQVTNGVNYFGGTRITSTPAFTWSGSILQLGNNTSGSSLYFSNGAYRSIREETNASGGQNLDFYNSHGANSGGSFNFEGSDNSDNWLSIQNAGNVGIGIPTANNLLEIVAGGSSNQYASQGVTTPFLIASSSGGTATTTIFQVSSTGTTTIANGVDITSGCYELPSGSCITQNNGTVTSVGLSSTNSTLTVGVTPVTTSGTITADLNLGHSNWWTATQNFTNASTSELTATSSVWLISLATPAGTFLAVDPNGKIIATSTPAVGGGGTVTSIATNNGITGGTITTSGTLSLDQTFGAVWTAASSTYTQHLALNTASTTQLTAPLIWTNLTAFKLLSTDANGQMVATSTIGNTLLANSTISGVALGGTLASHSVGSSLTGTAYNGSAAVSDWNINLSHSNWWTATQNFTQASTSMFTATSSVWFTGVTASRLLAVDNNGMLVATTSIGANLLAANGVSAGSYTNANITVAANGIVTAASNGSAGGGGGNPFTNTSSPTRSATTTEVDFFGNASSTEFEATSTVWLDNTKSAILLTDSNGKVGTYAGAGACSSNNFVTTISALGATTCGTASISGVNLGGTLASLSPDGVTLSGSAYNGSSAISNWAINLANGNIWTAASSTYTGHLSLNTASTSQVSSPTIWDSGVGNALWLGDANGKATAYGGASNPCAANQAPTTLSAVGALGGCTSTFQVSGTYITSLGNYATTTGTAISISTSTETTNGVTQGLIAAVSNNAIQLTPTISGTLANAGLAHSTIVLNSQTLTLGDSGDTITAASSTLLANNNTFLGNNIFTASTTFQSQINAQGASTTLLSANTAWIGTLNLTNALSIANGGTGQTTQQAALNALMPTSPNAGEVAYYNGSNWVGLAGNSSGTKVLQETSSGVPSWVANGAGTQTPWTSNIDGGGFALNDAGTVTGTNFIATSSNETATSSFPTMYVGNTGNSGTNIIADFIGQRVQMGPVQYPANYVSSCSTCFYLMLDKSSTANDVSEVFRDQGNARAEIGLVGDDSLHFKTVTGTYPTESFSDVMTLTPAKNVGIGTTSPTSLLSVGTNSNFTVDYSGDASTTGAINIDGAFNPITLAETGAGNGKLVIKGTEASGQGAYEAFADSVLGNVGYFGQNSVINGGTAYGQFDFQSPQATGSLCFSSGGRSSATGGVNCDLLDTPAGYWTMGTSTPGWGSLTIATSTAPQLSLSDGISTDPEWAFRNVSGNFYLASSTASATSSTSVFGVNGSTGVISFFGAATTTFAGGINLTNGGCFAINGTCIGGGGSGRTKSTQVEIPWSDCTPIATSTDFAIGGAFFEPDVISNVSSFTSMAMDFGYATSSEMDCIVQLPTDYSSGLTFGFAGIVSTSTSGTVAMDVYATSTAAAQQYNTPTFTSTSLAVSSSTTGRWNIAGTAGVGTTTPNYAFPSVTGLAAGQDLLFKIIRYGASTTADTIKADLLVSKMYYSYSTQ